jgi:hypothetical protein
MLSQMWLQLYLTITALHPQSKLHANHRESPWFNTPPQISSLPGYVGESMPDDLTNCLQGAFGAMFLVVVLQGANSECSPSPFPCIDTPHDLEEEMYEVIIYECRDPSNTILPSLTTTLTYGSILEPTVTSPPNLPARLPPAIVGLDSSEAFLLHIMDSIALRIMTIQ